MDPKLTQPSVLRHAKPGFVVIATSLSAMIYVGGRHWRRRNTVQLE